MTGFDAINAMFELGGAFFVLLSVMRLHRDKQVHGVSWATVLFFTAFGIWNCAYYPSLNQWYSLVGALALVGMNTVWLAQLIYYTRKERVA